MIAFGPVPSRRLGASLGVNPMPRKVCTYSCVYCQVGRTLRLRVRRLAFRDPDQVVEAVSAKVVAARGAAEAIDYITIVPDGEPTLDLNLGGIIRGLGSLGFPIAVITNGSLLTLRDVRTAVAAADWVSLKVDAADEATWRRINRPHGRLRLANIQQGMREFAVGFGGRLTTETMLVAGVNDGEAALRATAAFVAELSPRTAYLAVPTRPPAEAWVRWPSQAALARACVVFRGEHRRVECLGREESDGFALTGDVGADLLAIAAVHPLCERTARRMIQRRGADWSVVVGLLARGELLEVLYRGERYFRRAFPAPAGPAGG